MNQECLSTFFSKLNSLSLNMDYHDNDVTKCPDDDSDSEHFILELSSDNDENDEDQYLVSYLKIM